MQYCEVKFPRKFGLGRTHFWGSPISRVTQVIITRHRTPAFHMIQTNPSGPVGSRDVFGVRIKHLHVLGIHSIILVIRAVTPEE